MSLRIKCIFNVTMVYIHSKKTSIFVAFPEDLGVILLNTDETPRGGGIRPAICDTSCIKTRVKQVHTQVLVVPDQRIRLRTMDYIGINRNLIAIKSEVKQRCLRTINTISCRCIHMHHTTLLERIAKYFSFPERRSLKSPI